MKTKLVLIFCCLGMVFAASGCSWVGKKAGQTSAKIERKTTDIKKGYNEGYSEEKGKEKNTEE